MPPLPPVPQVIKVVIGGTYHDAHWETIHYISYTGSAPTSSNLVSASIVIGNAFSTVFAAEASADCEFTLVTCTDLTSSTGATGDATYSVFGTRSGDFNPASVALVISKEVNRRYRGGHPRNYYPFGTSGTMETASTIFWDSSFLADVQTKINTFHGTVPFTEGATNFANWANVSYVDAGVRRVTPVVDVVGSFIAKQRICSQRRRLGKIGS